MAEAGVETPCILVVKLHTGDELEIDGGSDAEFARARLASFYRDLATHEFVLFDDDTVVRSNQITHMQVRKPEQSRAAIGRAVKSTSGGDSEVSTHGSEQGTTIRVQGARREDRADSPARHSQPLLDPPRQRGSETKPFFLTSEFVTATGVIAAIAIAMSQLDNFNANRGWLLITIIAAAYILSRGIAKAGSRSPSEDARERLAWGDADR